LNAIRILGGGPAGASAAIAALREGRAAHAFEKSRFPRHKVCGEFLSSEIAATLDQLGLSAGFHAAGPALIRRLSLHFPSSEKSCPLPEIAYGLSRFRFDELLLDEAIRLGARVTAETTDNHASPCVVAHGRKFAPAKGNRLFGFKAHFEGPANDAVELYFFAGCYVGINPIEGGLTNVCGIGPETLLKSRDFEIDAVIDGFEPLARRLRPLTRRMKWLMTGPLEFRNRFHVRVEEGRYPAGDALSFVDPFTGTGILSAVATGRLAGIAAARSLRTDEYLRECRRRLQTPFLVSSVFRGVLARGWADRLAQFVPGAWLVRLTRPQV
jgi:flavin-dependent dehydrogenase